METGQAQDSEFVTKVTAAMKRLGWSPARLAKESGFVRSTISKILNGHTDGSPVVRRRMLFVLGLEDGVNGDERAFLAIVRRLPPDVKTALEALVRAISSG